MQNKIVVILIFVAFIQLGSSQTVNYAPWNWSLAYNSAPFQRPQKGSNHKNQENYLWVLNKKASSCFSDLAALIKEKNRNIDKLESALEKQSMESEKQIQELNEQVSASRARRKDVNTTDKRDEVHTFFALLRSIRYCQLYPREQ